MVETRINSATSATVKNRAFAWDSTLASLLRACWHCTPLWLLWPVSTEPLQDPDFGQQTRANRPCDQSWRGLRTPERGGEVCGKCVATVVALGLAQLPGALRGR